jgi:hypothetical protein
MSRRLPTFGAAAGAAPAAALLAVVARRRYTNFSEARQEANAQMRAEEPEMVLKRKTQLAEEARRTYAWERNDPTLRAQRIDAQKHGVQIHMPEASRFVWIMLFAAIAMAIVMRPFLDVESDACEAANARWYYDDKQGFHQTGNRDGSDRR